MTAYILAVLTVLVLAALCAWLGSYLGARNRDIAWNAQLGVSEHEHGVLGSLRADAAIASRYMLVKTGSDYLHVAIVAAASDEPLGVCVDAPYAQGDLAATRLLDGVFKGTQTMVAAGAIGVGADVYSDGIGKVTVEPTVAGVYWLVGRNVGQAAANSGDYVEVAPCRPLKLVVLAEFTAVTTPVGSDAGTTQTLANAIKTDLTALRTAMPHPALLKLL